MGHRVILELPGEVMGRAERLAVLRGQKVQQILTDTLSDALPPAEAVMGECVPIDELSDGEVMRVADLRLPPEEDRRLSTLLARQQEGPLTDEMREELGTLMQVYYATVSRQADGLAEAVRRGLREPLAP